MTALLRVVALVLDALELMDEVIDRSLEAIGDACGRLG